jgi:hypothetical protein
VLLVLEDFLSKLVTFFLNRLVLLLQLLVVAIAHIASQILFNLVCEVLIKILRNFQLFFHNFQLVLERLTQSLVFLIARFIST